MLIDGLCYVQYVNKYEQYATIMERDHMILLSGFLLVLVRAGRVSVHFFFIFPFFLYECC